MKPKIQLLSVILMLFFFVSGCTKEDPSDDNNTVQKSIPTVSTVAVTSVTTNSATGGGNITSDGNASVSARGVCWSNTSNPTTGNHKTTNGSGTGSFSSNITGLSASTTYYVRAYATNSEGTAYGNQVSFTTSDVSGPNPPSVSTASATSITSSSAVSGGNVTSDGGASVSARGVCWSTAANPTTADNKTTNGSGTGSFTSNLTGLSASTSYYVRAYATNSAGTSYGNQVSFTTAAPTVNLPSLSTTTVSSITTSSAVSGGNITNSGGASVTVRGVCWSTSQNPTTSSSHTTDGSGTGSYSSTLSGLSSSTTYYVRAYATNTAGTAYGNQLSFTTATPASPPAAPSGLSVNASSPSTISLSWNDNSNNETGFEIQRKHPTISTFYTVTTVGANVTHYSHTGLSETWPEYRVRATGTAGNSGFSNTAYAPAKIRIINNLYSSTPSSGNDWYRLNKIGRVRIGPSSAAVTASGNTYERLCPYDMLYDYQFATYADWINPSYNSTSQYRDYPVSTYGYGSTYYVYLECMWWDYIVLGVVTPYWQKTNSYVLCADGQCCCLKWAWTQIINHSAGYFVITATELGLPYGSWNNTIKGSNEGRIIDARK